MAHLVDKDRIVAEIEKWQDEIKKGIFSIPLTGSDRAYAALEYEILGKVKSFIDTLEVKEVDLEKEMQAFAKLYLEPLKISDSNIGISITMSQLYSCAKHFFALGLKAQKGE